MNVYTEFLESARDTSGGTPCQPRYLALFEKLKRTAIRIWHQSHHHKSICELNRLDEHMLKDVGLFREHLPNGAIHYSRR
ncbi:hypothetical protein [Jannaschia faecimaris]|nr:hypothetical protein [Jannaschia faecimaris]